MTELGGVMRQRKKLSFVQVWNKICTEKCDGQNGRKLRYRFLDEITGK